MSSDANRWAWTLPLKDLLGPNRKKASTYRLVLLTLAERAGEDHTAWPSVPRMVTDTCLDRKTIISALQGLTGLGLIEDTGKRKGGTGQVKVYQLLGVDDRITRKNSGSNSHENSGLNSPLNGTVKESQERNSTENGTVPFFPLKSPKNGTQNLKGTYQYNSLSDAGDDCSLFDQPDTVTNTDGYAVKKPHRFAMNMDWLPSNDFNTVAAIAGVNLAELEPADFNVILHEFRTYWVNERPGTEFAQATWQQKLMNSIRHGLRGKNNEKRNHTGAANRNGSPSGRSFTAEDFDLNASF